MDSFDAPKPGPRNRRSEANPPEPTLYQSTPQENQRPAIKPRAQWLGWMPVWITVLVGLIILGIIYFSVSRVQPDITSPNPGGNQITVAPTTKMLGLLDQLFQPAQAAPQAAPEQANDQVYLVISQVVPTSPVASQKLGDSRFSGYHPLEI